MDFSSLGTTEWLIIAGVVLLIVVVLVAVMASRRRRRHSLQQRYGPEYERTVRARGGERAARADLSEREKKHEHLDLRDLSGDERHRFGARMAVLQYRFAEDPAGAVYESGRVAADALQARGYPIANDRDLALRLLAVDHPREAQPLRTAIEGTYGKDPGLLRETFVGVRDGLREALAVHYTYEDGVEGSSSPPVAARGRSGPAAAAAPALAAAGASSGDRDRGSVPATETVREDRDEPAAHDRDEDGTRGDEDATRGGRHAATGESDDDPGPESPGHDRTVRLGDPDGRGDNAPDDQPPVGAVPPPPAEGGATRP